MKVLVAIAVLALSVANPAMGEEPVLVNRYNAMLDAIEVFAVSYCNARALNASPEDAVESATIDLVDVFYSKYDDFDVAYAELLKIDKKALREQMAEAVVRTCPGQ